FCREYVIDQNGNQAAIRAGYSPKTANEQAAQLLAKLSIKEYVQSLLDQRAEKLQLTAEDVLNDILETRKAAAEDGKHSDRLKANELLGKHLKLFTDKSEVTGKDGSPLEMVITKIVKSADNKC
ncbi:MAG: terminase small subunit, partial [Hyphomicrobiaceae bacterium]